MSFIITDQYNVFDSIRFENFKSLQQVNLPLQPLTVFVGPNGSGKTSVLEGIHLGSRLLRSKPNEVFKGRSDVRRLITQGGSTAMSLSLRANLETLEIRCRCLSDPDPGDGSPSPEFEFNVDHFAHPTEGTGVYSWDEFGEERRQRTRDRLGQSAFLRLDPAKLAAPTDSSSMRIRSDGEGLAAVIAGLKLNDLLEPLVADLKSIVPSVKGVRPIRTTFQRTEMEMVRVGSTSTELRREVTVSGFALEFETSTGTRIPADLISEGTLLTLGLLTVLKPGPSGPTSVILIDDIDRALHPLAQKSLIDLIRRMQKSEPRLQVIATSHSPYLIDCLEPEEVVLTSLHPENGTRCLRLSDHPSADKWRKSMMTGEFWSMVGEDWVLEHVAASEAS